jgi:hypothetical protein
MTNRSVTFATDSSPAPLGTLSKAKITSGTRPSSTRAALAHASPLAEIAGRTHYLSRQRRRRKRSSLPKRSMQTPIVASSLLHYAVSRGTMKCGTLAGSNRFLHRAFFRGGKTQSKVVIEKTGILRTLISVLSSGLSLVYRSRCG